ncbi:hypothetical protein HYH03_005822 [Edaphochlamys debaryana]|uniref:Calcium-transporting ATPase n=1 Tax=Edaphochlamys debaryana TaxID=47281 RepID=A0A836C256_9CHLO|nr:hypothetical protein HYH03_005822 [Edaphochlamys debaryana]|eukprot:KAG2496224.1 hypothetical protein HYH03_005822 [Edaphochlamys debaryana]
MPRQPKAPKPSAPGPAAAAAGPGAGAPAAPPAPPVPPFAVTRDELVALNDAKDTAALQDKYGGAAGLAAALCSDLYHGIRTAGGGASAAAGAGVGVGGAGFLGGSGRGGGGGSGHGAANGGFDGGGVEGGGSKGMPSLAERVEVFGSNHPPVVPPKSLLGLIWGNLQDPILLLLIAAALVSTVLGAAIPEQRHESGWVEGVAIWVAIAVVVLVASFNDYSKDRQFAALNRRKDLTDVTVVRDGRETRVQNTELVVGDILVLASGDKVPADGVLAVPGLDRGGLMALDEASLTGESEAVRKDVAEDPWVRCGTQVQEGGGKVLVLAVGPDTEYGKTMAIIGAAGGSDTPLTEKLGHLAGAIGKVGAIAAVTLFVILMIIWMVENRGFPISKINKDGPVQFFLYCVTIVVVAVPEGLPLAVTISLAYSMRQMMDDQCFVRVLEACETMGGCTAICSDKTGTLTQNRMTVVEAWVAPDLHFDRAPLASQLPPALLEELQLNIALNSRAFLVEPPALGTAAPHPGPHHYKPSPDSDAPASTARKPGAPEPSGPADGTGAYGVTTVGGLYAAGVDFRGDLGSSRRSTTSAATTPAFTPTPGPAPPPAGPSAASSFAAPRSSSAGGSSFAAPPSASSSFSFPWMGSARRGSTASARGGGGGGGGGGGSGRDLEMGRNGSSASGSGRGGEDGVAGGGGAGGSGRQLSRIGESEAEAASPAGLGGLGWLLRPFTRAADAVADGGPPEVDDGSVTPGGAPAGGFAPPPRTTLVGNRTECALLVLMDYGWGGRTYDAVRKEYEGALEHVYAFTSERKMSSVVVRLPDGSRRLYVKGAAEWVLRACGSVATGATAASAAPLDGARRGALGSLVEGLAGRGLRCIALAAAGLPGDPPGGRPEGYWEEPPEPEGGLTLQALMAIKDPVRPEVPAAVAACQRAGITVRMVTGDNVNTARFIATECGILTPGGQALEGPAFRALSDEQLAEALPRLQVLARSSPSDKFRLVSALKALREVVAVTGDGTNDAPALKESDVGLAMGITGTEVAKEAADIVVLDDNFSSIVRAVLWGRTVFENIRKFVAFQLTVNIVALVVAFVGAIAGGREPLTVLQLLWVNLIMDTLAALALATERPDPQILDRKPYGRSEHLITGTMLRYMLTQAAYQIAVLFFILYALPSVLPGRYGTGVDPDHVRSLSLLFNTFIFCQVFNEINSRRISDELNVFARLHRSPIFVAVLLVTVGAQVIIVELLGSFFSVEPLSWGEWLVSIGLGAVSLPLSTLVRLAGRAAHRRGEAREGAKQGQRAQGRGTTGIGGGDDVEGVTAVVRDGAEQRV